MKKVSIVFGITILLAAALIAMAITKEEIKDPVCNMTVDPATATAKIEGKAGTVYFCNLGCLHKFAENPTAYLSDEKLKEMQICAGEYCYDPECDGCNTSQVEAAASSCAGCPGQAKAAEVEKAADCSGDCNGCTIDHGTTEEASNDESNEQ